MSALDEIRQRAAIAERSVVGALRFARTDAPRLLAAVDAVLALADTYTKEFTAHNEAESMLRAAAYAIRAKVNDALETTK